MPGPIGSCTPSSSTDEILHRVLSLRPDASALPTPHAAPDSAREQPAGGSYPSDPALDTLHHAGTGVEVVMTTLEVLEPVAEGAIEHAHHLGTNAVASLSGMVTSIASQVLAVYGTLAEGEREGMEVDSRQMQGALAALEGRLDDADVRDRAAHDPAFASGLRTMERLFIADNASFMCAAQQIRGVIEEGERAVLMGRDRGGPFEGRYDYDLAFRHGVERARERRELSPAEYESMQREIRDLEQRMEAARIPGVVRG